LLSKPIVFIYFLMQITKAHRTQRPVETPIALESLTGAEPLDIFDALVHKEAVGQDSPSPFSQDTATPTRTETGIPRSVIRFMAAIRA
jgi:hypothetical protein